MKSSLLIMLCLALATQVPAQDTASSPVKNNKKFSIGLEYSFNSTKLKYYSFSDHYLWNSVDYGEQKMSSDELDELNSKEQVRSSLNTVRIYFGMMMLRNTHWTISGRISLGPSSFWYDIQNKSDDRLEREMASELRCATTSLDFNFGYHFGAHWGVNFQPSALYTFGSMQRITDNVFPVISYMEETRKNSFNYVYARVNLTASYSIKGFTVSAGPGFYYLYLANDYHVDRLNTQTGDSYTTEIKTAFCSKFFIDGSIMLEWTIVPAFSISTYCGLGQDLYIQPGVRYNF